MAYFLTRYLRNITNATNLSSVSSQLTFVSECVVAHMTAERFCSGVLPVVIVQLGLRFETLCADVAHELALAGVQFRMSSEQGRLVEALVAARMLAPERFHHNLVFEQNRCCSC